MLKTSLLVIEKNRLFREGLQHLFAASSFDTVNQSNSVEEALPFVAALQPAIVLVGLSDNDEETACIVRIRAAASHTRIVFLTESIRISRLADALAEGADGYLLKTMSAAALHQSLQLILVGEKVFPTDLAHLLTNDRFGARNGSTRARHVNGLSDREMQILGRLLNGAQNRQIARDLQIAEGTVKVHLKSLLKKIGVQNRTQAALWARAQGMTTENASSPGGFDFSVRPVIASPGASQRGALTSGAPHHP
jgi:two-component system, NarL family, nitrate/nitrite response regulator NarL